MRLAGRRDRYITIETLSASQDGIGGITESWSTLTNVWAEVIPISGKEKLQSDREITLKQNRFIFDYISGLTEKDRILYDSEYYEIISIRELGRYESVEVLGVRVL